MGSKALPSCIWFLVLLDNFGRMQYRDRSTEHAVMLNKYQNHWAYKYLCAVVKVAAVVIAVDWAIADDEGSWAKK